MSSAVSDRVPQRLPLQDRYEFVLSRCAGARVLSIGLGGQPAETDYSFDLASSALEHTFSAAVARVASSTAFIDILQEAIDAYRPVIDADYWLADICAPPSEWPAGLREARFDVIVLGEVVEHLPNPGAALTGLQSVLADGGCFLITVPNAFNISVVGRMARGEERVHPEHVAYYSPRTLERLCALCGLRVDEVGFYRTRPLALAQLRQNPFGYAAGWLAERIPEFGKGVVATARPAVTTP